MIFIERTIKVAYPMKLITEINFEWAIQRAKECDE
jgi:hypothetical protein